MPPPRLTNAPTLPLSGVIYKDTSAAAEMRAYDQLPPILRETLRVAPIDISASMALAELRQTRNAALLAIEITDFFIRTLNEERAKIGAPPIKSLK